MDPAKCVKLNNGALMPLVGLGTWESTEGSCTEAVKLALRNGYNHIDGAFIYGNEAQIGDALVELFASGELKREDLFITSKLWNTFHHPDDVVGACKKSLDLLKLDYIDMYLIHWPYAFQRGAALFPKNADNSPCLTDDPYVETYKAMEKLVEMGLVRGIGLSNFNSEQVTDIINNCSITPDILQCECHPYLNQTPLIDLCKKHNITFTSYSPLGSPARPEVCRSSENVLAILDDKCLKKIAEKYNKTVAQIAIRYQVQRGVVVIPKSATPARIISNCQVFDFKMTSEEMEMIDNLNNNIRYIVPLIETGDGRKVPRDSGHKYYPFNIPY